MGQWSCAVDNVYLCCYARVVVVLQMEVAERHYFYVVFLDHGRLVIRTRPVRKFANFRREDGDAAPKEAISNELAQPSEIRYMHTN
jgi:hypothetical protein